MPRGEARIFECVTCEREYSKQDALKGKYFPLQRMCRKCYRKMAKAHPKVWCFGKPASGKLPGYSPENEVCSKLCPDRDVCKQFIQLKSK